MEYIKLNKETDYNMVDMSLYLQDVKVLYNACVDINKQYPEMIGYQKIAEKLQMVINEFDTNSIDVDLID